MNKFLDRVLKKKLSISSKMMKCNICNSDSFSNFWDCGEFYYVKCNICKLVMQNPQPKLESIYGIYDKDYFNYELDNQNNFFNLMKKGLKDIKFDFISKNLKEKKILDIGCATGLLLNYLKSKNWDTYGVEICKESAEYAKNKFGLQIYNKTIEKCNFKDNFFDVVHFSHVIEHVDNPMTMLKEVYRITKEKGYVIITTPNVNGIFAKIFKEKWRASIAQHLHLFSNKTLKKLITYTGFKIIKKISWGSIPIEIYKGKFKKVIDNFVKKTNTGDVMLFLARK